MATMETVTTASNDFAALSYKALLPFTKVDNVIFSPFSLYTILAMTDDRLMTLDEESLAESYRLLLESFKTPSEPPPFILVVANRVYRRANKILDPALMARLTEIFGVEIEALDFATPEARTAAAAKINAWVESTTRGKIKDLILPEYLTPNTAIIHVNAIYFNGSWEYPFQKSKTRRQSFHVTPNQTVDVEMMTTKAWFAIGDLPDLNARALALPYKGGRFAMWIILPNKVNGLTFIQQNIESMLVDGKSLIKDSLTKTTDVQVSLPKFKVEATITNLADVLTSKLGKQALCAGGLEGVAVSDVIQKAVIEVDEVGTEAAVATGHIRFDCYTPPPTPFNVDHPFYYQIVDTLNNGLVLFAGHVINPAHPLSPTSTDSCCVQ